MRDSTSSVKKCVNIASGSRDVGTSGPCGVVHCSTDTCDGVSVHPAYACIYYYNYVHMYVHTCGYIFGIYFPHTLGSMVNMYVVHVCISYHEMWK